MPQYVGFYLAPLVCEAAPQIGCGCRAKPVLARLEGEPSIERAWLHRCGNVIAIEWQRELDVGQQFDLLRAAFGDVGDMAALHPAQSSELLANFPDPQNWYCRGTVDQLSEEEAHTIAARLVLRLSREGVLLPDGAALQCDLVCALRDVLVADEAMSTEARRARLKTAAQDVLLQHLGPQMLPLLEAVLTSAALLPEGADPACAATSCPED